MFVIEQMRLAPTLVIGQSLGGQLALLVAARRPDLVRGLVVAEASPDGGDPETMRQAVQSIGDLLRQWPVPFPDRAASVRYFGGPSVAAEAWATGLEARAGGLFPSFEVETMERTLGEAMQRAYWPEWEQIRCPTLIVRAAYGTMSVVVGELMSERLPGAKLVEIPAAPHDLHLDAPAEWRSALTNFLDEVDGRGSRAAHAAPDVSGTGPCETRWTLPRASVRVLAGVGGRLQIRGQGRAHLRPHGIVSERSTKPTRGAGLEGNAMPHVLARPNPQRPAKHLLRPAPGRDNDASRGIRRQAGSGLVSLGSPTFAERGRMMQFVVGMALVAALACWAPSAHAALPGANGKILVQSNMTGHFDIYSINPDGSGMKNLTNGSVDSVNAKASPDGKHIIFFSDRDADNVMELWIMNADGSHQRLLYQPPLGVPGETGPYNGGFASNNVIVFDSDHNVSGGYPPGEEIYTINIDGTGLKRLTYNNFFDGDPSIRPDGKQIVFTSDRDTNSTTNEVYTMTATGSNVTRLTHNAPAQDFGPSYSPDGKKIVWYTNVAGHFDIFTMNDNGSGKMNLTHSSGPDNTNPTFSPDGTKVAFSSNRDTGSSQTSEIYTMNVHGSNVTRLTLGGTSTNVPTGACQAR